MAIYGYQSGAEAQWIAGSLGYQAGDYVWQVFTATESGVLGSVSVYKRGADEWDQNSVHAVYVNGSRVADSGEISFADDPGWGPVDFSSLEIPVSSGDSIALLTQGESGSTNAREINGGNGYFVADGSWGGGVPASLPSPDQSHAGKGFLGFVEVLPARPDAPDYPGQNGVAVDEPESDSTSLFSFASSFALLTHYQGPSDQGMTIYPDGTLFIAPGGNKDRTFFLNLYVDGSWERVEIRLVRGVVVSALRLSLRRSLKSPLRLSLLGNV